FPDQGVVDAFGACAVAAYFVAGPALAEGISAGREFTDEVGQGLVVGVAADFGAQGDLTPMTRAGPQLTQKVSGQGAQQVRTSLVRAAPSMRVERCAGCAPGTTLRMPDQPFEWPSR